MMQNICANPQINAVKLTPSHADFLNGLSNDHIKVAIVGGEQLHWQQIRQIQSINPTIRVINEYGPTEATIGCAVFEIEKSAAWLR